MARPQRGDRHQRGRHTSSAGPKSEEDVHRRCPRSSEGRLHGRTWLISDELRHLTCRPTLFFDRLGCLVGLLSSGRVCARPNLPPRSKRHPKQRTVVDRRKRTTTGKKSTLLITRHRITTRPHGILPPPLISLPMSPSSRKLILSPPNPRLPPLLHRLDQPTPPPHHTNPTKRRQHSDQHRSSDRSSNTDLIERRNDAKAPDEHRNNGAQHPTIRQTRQSTTNEISSDPSNGPHDDHDQHRHDELG